MNEPDLPNPESAPRGFPTAKRDPADPTNVGRDGLRLGVACVVVLLFLYPGLFVADRIRPLEYTYPYFEIIAWAIVFLFVGCLIAALMGTGAPRSRAGRLAFLAPLAAVLIIAGPFLVGWYGEWFHR